MNYKALVFNNPKYSFLKENKHLGDNIILLTLSGSIAYGTNIKTSDLDVRGTTLERPNELLGLDNFEQFENKETDTTIYSFRKLVNLLLNCNPNCIEILATNTEHILIISEEGKQLRDNLGLFLSQRAANSFAGYATAQLRRLENALARDSYPQPEKEKHILNSIIAQMYHLQERYTAFTDGELNLYIGDSDKEDYETEIYLDISLKGYPLRDFKNIYSEMSNIVSDYGKLNKRNSKKDYLHLYKHAMHLIRLLLMGTEILKGEPVRTFRKEREFLLDIRNQKYSFDQIFEMVKIYEKEFQYAKENSPLPVKPDYNKVNELVIHINKRAIQ